MQSSHETAHASSSPDSDQNLVTYLKSLHFKKVDVEIIKYLKAGHRELYMKLKTAVRSCKEAK